MCQAASYGYAFLLLSLHLPVLALALVAQWARLEWYLQLHAVAPTLTESLAQACAVLIGGCQPHAGPSSGQPTASRAAAPRMAGGAGLMTMPQFLLGMAALFVVRLAGTTAAAAAAAAVAAPSPAPRERERFPSPPLPMH